MWRAARESLVPLAKVSNTQRNITSEKGSNTNLSLQLPDFFITLNVHYFTVLSSYMKIAQQEAF